MKAHLPLFYGLCLVTFLFDVLSKFTVFQWLGWDHAFPAEMQQGRSIRILGDFLQLTGGLNTGVAFSFLTGNNALLKIVMVAAVFSIGYAVQRMRSKHPIVYVGMGLILGGAAGNLFDRFLYNGVRDFIKVGLFSFPIFNLADTAITIGATLIVVYLVFEERFEPGKSRKPEAVDIATRA